MIAFTFLFFTPAMGFLIPAVFLVGLPAVIVFP